ARKKVVEVIENKAALNKLKTMVAAQGGSLALFDGLPMKATKQAVAKTSGKVIGFKTKRLGALVGEMGSIRQTLADKIEYNVGVITHHKIGDKVEKGDVMLDIFAKSDEQAKEFEQKLLDCIIIG
ncbi:MAG: hypothetical protein IJA69_04845, partial [Clostridia bacterium]|nr:hypothetical protein [Clostridia bacterium]